MKNTVKSMMCAGLIMLSFCSLIIAVASLECDCIGFLAFSIWSIITLVVFVFSVRNYNMEQNRLKKIMK